ncbi:MAG: LysM peptidoglycan-binding domain-containing protein [Sporocytophaga sp.]|nr:LysM peptidoglycan-binding domain-containing protein [Sporocytophaga sp.]
MEPEVHRVGPYDTLETISKIYGVSVEDLKKLNNLEEDTITAGMIIKLK